MDIGQQCAVESDPEVSYGPEDENIYDYIIAKRLRRDLVPLSVLSRCSDLEMNRHGAITAR
jgi:hypothetical protein